MRKRTYYRLWTDLVAKYPELNRNKNYFIEIENGDEVRIDDLTFGKNEMRDAYEQYYVETKEPYGFDATAFNVYDDLVPTVVREYLPMNVIRGIRNAKSDFVKRDGEYIVEYEYLPLLNKTGSNNSFYHPINTALFKIGDWILIKDSEYYYNKNIGSLAEQYDVTYNAFKFVGNALTYDWNTVVEAHRNLKNTTKEVQILLKTIREKFWILYYEKQSNQNIHPEFTLEELMDSINLITKLLTLPIIIKFTKVTDIWKYGSTSVATKVDAKFLIDAINNQNLSHKLALSSINNPTSQFGAGGNIAQQNYQMTFNDAHTISHHAKELLLALQNYQEIPAWVVAKIHQASTTLSDITHYLEGTKFANGGSTPELAYKIGTALKMKYSDDKYQLVSFSDHGYTVAKKVNGELVEYKSFPYNIIEHGLFTKA